MKNKKIFLLRCILFAAVAAVTATSCSTTKFVLDSSFPSEELNINESGRITFGKAGDNSEDIYITGYLDDKNGLNIVTSIMGVNTKKLTFNGKITIDEIEYTPQISMLARYNSHRYTEACALRNVTMTDLSENTIVVQFDLLNSDDFMVKDLKFMDMPYYFAEFVSDGNIYRICTSRFLAKNQEGKGHQSPYELFSTPDQLFQIVDEDENLIAEYNSYSYSIFSNDVDVDEFKLVIASFVIAGTVCSY